MLIKSYSDRCQRSKIKQEKLLKFLRDETWSNAENLAHLLSISHTAIYKTLKRMGKLEYIKFYYIPELRFNIWGITPLGLLYSWSEHETMEDRYVFEPSKVKPAFVMHHLDLQKARLQAEKAGWENWIPGNLLGKSLAKRPDAVVTDTSKQKNIAVELERTIKTKKRYQVIFSTYLQAIKQGEYNSVHYVCPDRVFSTRLIRMFQLIKSVPVGGEHVVINDKHRARFQVYFLEQWPDNYIRDKYENT